MGGKLLAQLSWVALRDAEAVDDPYAWPRRELTPEERLEVDRLRTLSARLWYRAAERGWGSAGLEEAFQ
jgi:hypothetical protein